MELSSAQALVLARGLFLVHKLAVCAIHPGFSTRPGPFAASIATQTGKGILARHFHALA